MSEVDKLSNSGLYPALPISDKRKDRGPPGKPPGTSAEEPPGVDGNADKNPRPPKSLIDEYA
jgi:hypothetical protein